MRQVILTKPKNLEFREVPSPSTGDLKDNQLLLNIKRIGICGSEIHSYHGLHPATFYPVVQGHEYSAQVVAVGKNVKIASLSLVKLGTAEKNKILAQVADALLAETDFILQENARDVAKAQENGISPVMVDRLRLDAGRIEGIVEGVRQVADLQDPIGQVVRGYTNLDGLKIVQKLLIF